jgi:hypothetical protein
MKVVKLHHKFNLSTTADKAHYAPALLANDRDMYFVSHNGANTIHKVQQNISLTL